RNGKQGKHLPGLIGVKSVFGKGDQVDVGRVQHQLHTEENHHRVPFGQHPVQSHTEQDGTQCEVGSYRHHDLDSFRARMTAPTKATRSNTETASKGITYCLNTVSPNQSTEKRPTSAVSSVKGVR